MIDLWRSEEMQLIQLIIPSDAAHDTMAALGEIGCLQFKDLNPDKSAFQRTYANQVKRCDEMVRKIRFFTDQVAKAEIVPSPRMGDFQYDLDELDVKLEELEDELLQMNNNGERLGRSYAELLELQLVLERARTFFDYGGGMVDMQPEGFNVHSGAGTSGSDNMDAPLLETTTGMDTKMSRLGYVAGMIELEKVVSFERLLFRSTRGNMYLRQTSVGQVKDPTSGEMKEKAVFVVFFAGERARAKILKICEAYGANRYPVPEDVNRQRQMNGEVTARLKELKETIDAGDSHRQGLLQNIATNLESWTVTVRREKAVYHQLNKLSIDVTRKCLVAEAWAPVDRRQDIQAALQSATERSNAMVGTVFQPLASHEAPPTHYNTTKVQSAFQAIVDAYGVARYREVNPATFTIITFPFLFAVMFGDLGHAFLMLLFAIWLIWNEKTFLKQKLNDMLDMAFAGRYVVLLMAIFSIFTGIIYNEFFSIPMTLFGDTKYRCAEADLVTIRGQPELGIPARIPALEDDGDDFRDCYVFTNSSTCTYGNITRSCIVASEDDGGHLEFFTLVQKEQSEGYPFGVDPVWHGTDTELEFLNSMKMKMSIILGVSQMNLGIIMSLFNQTYFRDTLSIWCEFIPQMLFLNGLFGYMSFVMVYKWASYIPTMEDKSVRTSYDAFAPGLCPEFGAPPTDSCPYTARAPDIFHIMIYMFLEPFNVDCSYMPGEYNPTNGTKAPCPENVYWGDISSGGTPTQAYFQVLLVVVALLCIPWMLLIKPFILKKRHQERTQGQQYNSLRDADPETDALAGEAVAELAGDGGGGGGGGGHGDEFEFGEVMVHQMIHTIEFVLGAVSNTASYLRLWALSLAHSQLSAVFYDQLLMRATALDGATMQTVGLFIAYFVWALATMGVLMVMESLSAFLHALRLHWVEFQNKFFHGDGYAFAPFSFEEVDKEAL